jgi:hypothetical protein
MQPEAAPAAPAAALAMAAIVAVSQSAAAAEIQDYGDAERLGGGGKVELGGEAVDG